ncbi:MAG: DsrE family protein [Firmicutes bacterium]|nr:DsrE family protein [Bacillota bacterium]
METRPILYVLTMYSEAFQRTQALLKMAAIMASEGLTIEFLTTGTGVEVYRSNGMSSGQMLPLLTAMHDAGIKMTACTNAMKAMGLSQEEMFPVVDEFVIGGKEVAARIKDGYQVLPF